MTATPPGKDEGVVGKGLARQGRRLRHDLSAKCVDASLFRVEERLHPNDAGILADGSQRVDGLAVGKENAQPWMHGWAFELVEAAGVEPASEKQSPTGATCFVDL